MMQDNMQAEAKTAQPGEAHAPQTQDALRAEDKIIRARQRSRATVMGLILGGLAILFYAIAIAKMTGAG